jgi:hypothetical protein
MDYLRSRGGAGESWMLLARMFYGGDIPRVFAELVHTGMARARGEKIWAADGPGGIVGSVGRLLVPASTTGNDERAAVGRFLL